jgi:hypothetical protein
MASVEEVRAGIAMANEKASESISALQQATMALEQAQTAFANATEGSTQVDIHQASGLLAQAIANITDAQHSVIAGITTAEGYSSRL